MSDSDSKTTVASPADSDLERAASSSYHAAVTPPASDSEAAPPPASSASVSFATTEAEDQVTELPAVSASAGAAAAIASAIPIGQAAANQGDGGASAAADKAAIIAAAEKRVSKAMAEILSNAIVIPQTAPPARRQSSPDDGHRGPSKGCLIEAYRFLGPKADPKRSLVLHSEAEDHSAHQEGHGGHQSEMSAEVKVGFNELFFDLVFVAVVVRLGVLYKADLSWARTSEVVLLFVTYWLTWFHSNMLLTRFRIRSIWYFNLLGVMLGVLLLSICAVREEYSKEKGYYKTKSGTLKLAATVGMVAILRFLFLTEYMFICAFNPTARPLIKKYVAALFLSCGLLAVAVVLNDQVSTAVLWTIALLVEIVMYPMADLTSCGESVVRRRKQSTLPIEVEHNVERNGLWVVLILGESVISLSGATYAAYDDLNYIGTVCLGFLCVFMMLNLYMHSQPEHECGMDTHACDIGVLNSLVFNLSHLGITLGLFGMGIGLKFMVYYAAPDYKGHGFDRDHAFLFCTGVSFALFWLNVARGSHKWAQYGDFHRDLIWAIHVLISLSIAPVCLLADPAGHGHGLSSSAVLGIVAGILAFLTFLDSFLRPSPENWAVFEAFKLELERIKQRKKNLISGPAGFTHIESAPAGATAGLMKMANAIKSHAAAAAAASGPNAVSGPVTFIQVNRASGKAPTRAQYTRGNKASQVGAVGSRRRSSARGITNGEDNSPQVNAAVEAASVESSGRAPRPSGLFNRFKSRRATGDNPNGWLAETAVADSHDEADAQQMTRHNTDTVFAEEHDLDGASCTTPIPQTTLRRDSDQPETLSETLQREVADEPGKVSAPGGFKSVKRANPIYKSERPVGVPEAI